MNIIEKTYTLNGGKIIMEEELQTTFNEDSLEILVEEGSVENVISNED